MSPTAMGDMRLVREVAELTLGVGESRQIVKAFPFEVVPASGDTPLLLNTLPVSLASASRIWIAWSGVAPGFSGRLLGRR